MPKPIPCKPGFMVAAVAALLWLTALSPALSLATPLDVVLALDNSGSMKKNDPARITGAMAKRLWDGLPADSRMAMVVFADRAVQTMDFTATGGDGSGPLYRALTPLDYSGRWTNLQSAMERATYLHKLDGREQAAKAIILLTDGMMDTGNAARDAEGGRWLREELADYAARRGMHIYGIGLSNEADLMLLQTLAHKSGGDYYRVQTVAEFDKAFHHILARLQDLARPVEVAPVMQGEMVAMESVAAPPPPPAAMAAPPPQPPPSPPPPVAVIEPTLAPLAPARQASPPSPEASLLPYLLMAGGGAGLLLLGALFLRRKKSAAARPGVKPAAVADLQGGLAVLKDLTGFTGKAFHSIRHDTVGFGRVANPQFLEEQQFVLADPNVSRFHAVLQLRELGFFLMDNNSSNGSWVNDRQISGWQQVKHGDILRFGPCQFQLIIPGFENAERTVLSPIKSQPPKADAGMEPFRKMAGESLLMPVQAAAPPPERSFLELKPEQMAEAEPEVLELLDEVAADQPPALHADGGESIIGSETMLLFQAAGEAVADMEEGPVSPEMTVLLPAANPAEAPPEDASILDLRDLLAEPGAESTILLSHPPGEGTGEEEEEEREATVLLSQPPVAAEEAEATILLSKPGVTEPPLAPAREGETDVTESTIRF